MILYQTLVLITCALPTEAIFSRCTGGGETVDYRHLDDGRLEYAVHLKDCRTGSWLYWFPESCLLDLTEKSK